MEFSLGSLGRILFTSVLSSGAYWVGSHGSDHPLLVAAVLGLTVSAVVAGYFLIERWQSRGYRRLSDRVTIPDGPIRRAGDGGATGARTPAAAGPSGAASGSMRARWPQD